MEEAVEADRVLVMSEGCIALEGAPREVFRQRERLHDLQMELPQVTQLAHALAGRLPGFPNDVLTAEEMVAAIRQRIPLPGYRPSSGSSPEAGDGRLGHEPIIEVKDLVHFYMRGTPLEVKAVDGAALDVRRGEILGLIGHTGSGKSTIIQHFNALMRPHGGTVTLFGQAASSPDLDVLNLRRRVGLVFQQPEAQLFEQYVGDDVAYGPRNLKLSPEAVRERVRRAMEAVGLGFEEFKDRITFSLSGGQMRRVALAGVLALEPEVLVLDEPTSGLDPLGREQIMQSVLALRERGVTLVIISHNMEELARICDRVCIISEGRTVMVGAPAEVFGQPQALRAMGLGVPAVTEVVDRLRQIGLIGEIGAALTVAQAIPILEKVLA
jgi:energy-coupling factor transport system ATP-binding protein